MIFSDSAPNLDRKQRFGEFDAHFTVITIPFWAYLTSPLDDMGIATLRPAERQAAPRIVLCTSFIFVLRFLGCSFRLSSDILEFIMQDALDCRLRTRLARDADKSLIVLNLVAREHDRHNLLEFSCNVIVVFGMRPEASQAKRGILALPILAMFARP